MSMFKRKINRHDGLGLSRFLLMPITLGAIAATIVACICLGLGMQVVFRNDRLINENRRMKEDLQQVNEKLAQVDQSLEKLEALGSQLNYQSLFDVQELTKRTNLRGEAAKVLTKHKPIKPAEIVEKAVSKSNVTKIENTNSDVTPTHIASYSPPANINVSALFQRLDETLDLSKQTYEKLSELSSVLETRQEVLNRIPSQVPVVGAISSGFGMRKSPFTGRVIYHKGVDIAAPKGTVVVSAAKGKVVYSGWSAAYGKVVVISHGLGIVTKYAHNSELLVAEGQQLKKGDHIALVGSTGRSTGAHVHYEVWVSGVPVNPYGYLIDDSAAHREQIFLANHLKRYDDNESDDIKPVLASLKSVGFAEGNQVEDGENIEGTESAQKEDNEKTVPMGGEDDASVLLVPSTQTIKSSLSPGDIFTSFNKYPHGIRIVVVLGCLTLLLVIGSLVRSKHRRRNLSHRYHYRLGL